MNLRRKLIITTVISLLLVLAVLLGSASAVHRAAHRRTYSDAASVPHRRTGLVLGCSSESRYGGANAFFRNRIAAAASLFAAGKVDYLLVSGDNHVKGYDESTDMKLGLIHAGVPADRIYCDFAGFRTLDSVVRAREVFGQTEITVISQQFHNERAIYIASHRGVDAIGFNALDVDRGSAFATRCREHLARVKAVLDVWLLRTQPKFLGPKVQIGQGTTSL